MSLFTSSRRIQSDQKYCKVCSKFALDATVEECQKWQSRAVRYLTRSERRDVGPVRFYSTEGDTPGKDPDATEGSTSLSQDQSAKSTYFAARRGRVNDLARSWDDKTRYATTREISTQAGKGCKVCTVMAEVVEGILPGRTKDVEDYAQLRLRRSYELHGGVFLELSGRLRFDKRIMQSISADLVVKAFSWAPWFSDWVHLEIELHGAAGSENPFRATSTKKSLPRRLDDPKCFEVLRAWLSACESEHLGCRQPYPTMTGFAVNLASDGLAYLTDKLGLQRGVRPMPKTVLPTRVLDIGVNGRDSQCRLLLGDGRSAPYATLSYCWGDPGKVPKTTTGNLAERVESICEARLSKTFQDAIRITREVGLRYLWIDSLCILQDSAEDWAREAGRMGQIYRGAHLTIAVASGEDGSAGCLNQRKSRTDRRLQTAHELFNADLFATFGHHHLLPMQLAKGVEIPDFFRSYRLFSRKWCFQERMLNRRIVYYTEEELVWECAAQVQCECGRDTPSPELEPEPGSGWEGSTTKHQFNNLCIGAPVDSAFRLYLTLAREYAVRNISFDADVLPAFSAIAQPFSGAGLGDYHAGLWSSHLLHMLCWKTSDWRDPELIAAQFSILETSKSTFRRLSRSGVPSWSWLSVHATIDFPKSSHVPDSDHNAQIISVSCPTVREAASGCVQDANIHISARAWKATVARVEPAKGRIYWVDERKKSQTWYRRYEIDTTLDWDGLVGQDLWCAHIQGGYKLVLRRQEDGTFVRIGLDEPQSHDKLPYGEGPPREASLAEDVLDLLRTGRPSFSDTSSVPRMDFVIV